MRFTFLFPCICLGKLLQSLWIIPGWEGVSRGVSFYYPNSEVDSRLSSTWFNLAFCARYFFVDGVFSTSDVLFDHDDTGIEPPDQVGNISSWFGSKYLSNSQLTLLDIAMIERYEDQAMVLIEIEETSSNPKMAKLYGGMSWMQEQVRALAAHLVVVSLLYFCCIRDNK